MRAISLTLQAFGPYKEKQFIDFTQLGYETIFLITGPTGAGKTSVFDAIVYALYGRASGNDREHDTLRSHFAEEGQLTEVRFRFAVKEHQYEVIRAPKQLKKKARGDGFTEQPPKVELYKVSGEHAELLASKVKDVNETIESILHLDYEQFRKMIMIPQGEFRKLISENSKEREQILQRIFRTYIYDHVTGKLNDKAKQLVEQLKQLDYAEAVEIEKLDWSEEQKEQVTTSKKVFEQLKEQVMNEQNRLKEVKQSVQHKRETHKKELEKWYQQKQLQDRFKELHEKQQLLHSLQQQEKEMAKKKSVLLLAEQARNVRPYEENAIRMKQEMQMQSERLQRKQTDYTKATDRYTTIKKDYDEEVKQKEKREQMKQWITRSKEDLQKLSDFQQLQRDREQLGKQKEQQQQHVDALVQQRARYQEEIQQLSKATSDSQQLHKQYYDCESKEKDVQKVIEQWSRWNEEKQKLASMRVSYQHVAEAYEQQKQQVERTQLKVNKLEQEQKQQQAVQLASQLHAGESCPVCGSLEHPSKAKHTELFVSEDAIQAAKEQLNQAEQQLKLQENKFIDVKSSGQSQRQYVDQLQEGLDKSLSMLTETTSLENKDLVSVQQLKEQLRVQTIQLNNDIKKMEQQAKQVEQMQQALKKIEEQATLEQQKLQKVHHHYVATETKCNHIQSELADSAQDVETLTEKIEREEVRYKKWIARVEQLNEQYEEQRQQTQKLEVEVNQQTAYVQETKEKETKAVHAFVNACKQAGFETTEAYKTALLPEDTINQFKKEIEHFYTNLQTVKTTYEKLSEQLRNEQRPDVTEQETRLKQLEQQIEQITEQQQQLSMRIQEHQRILVRLQDLIAERETLEETYYYVGELAQLAKGDNAHKLSFERYVLSAFLDEIIIQANMRLDQMTEHRYQLQRSHERAKGGAQSGLDLEVLDHYTGQKRSVKTLSGGEGFKASLSLALGMSDVVQAQAGGIQLDTLFIDEGFGTLDEKSLEQAISCLKDLQEGNRLLGIISHVPQLKQEIQAKLEITPSPQGSTCAFTFG
ncbi:AAA family ATPase [Pontibacillus litoralis]|uniref:Nuclease SbcCD subunit C n=1 Tax=Pontibacillus litoralis JSM 072002 TaxID=1385512 RepID=A0A0A5G4J0_9BACI|nr:AAA family ATPase [Pontibacillus litoralis]KGX88016.1 hypothetical protein N784_12380 [Pontibacillus litoralis JSM 072002]